ncbi:MAG: ribonuclease III [Saprospiraceae bacterium]
MRFIRRFYNYYFHPDRELARRLKQLVGFTPVRLHLFKLAFFHKSTAASKDYATANNERLEFLGDAVLSTIVGEYLFKKYPNSDEGFLTKMRSKIVKRHSLDEIADRMGLDLFLANYNQTRLSKSMLGNALEALVGAVYIEQGYDSTKTFVIRRILRKYLDIHELELYDDNFKSQLLEWCQKNGRQIEYKVVAKYKSEKRDKFKVAVFVDGRKVGTADDFNKKSAEQLASERAMTSLGMLGGNGMPPPIEDEEEE